MGTESCPLKITLTACPSYVLRVQCLDRDEAFRVIKDAIEEMRRLIKERQGNLKVEREPWETTEDQKDKVAGEDDESGSDDDDDSSDEDDDEEEERGEIMEPSKQTSRRRK
eukprot:TRINITY_DN42385_c0_g1_i3.p3 TRINITY_DN42385_c0_g1~~TRINITY_DN42385_c0_g1_i3.p3  ORF type:complete len:111 (+),score=54.77 TRINITY_DN42385_c0_g1_i3:296-628(+)